MLTIVKIKSKFRNRLTDESIVNELRWASTKLPRRTKVFCTISEIMTHQTRHVSGVTLVFRVLGSFSCANFIIILSCKNFNYLTRYCVALLRMETKILAQ